MVGKKTLAIVLSPSGEPGRWRAEASGPAEDGTTRVVTMESYDRADVTKEAVIAWYAADEEEERTR